MNLMNGSQYFSPMFNHMTNLHLMQLKKITLDQIDFTVLKQYVYHMELFLLGLNSKTQNHPQIF